MPSKAAPAHPPTDPTIDSDDHSDASSCLMDGRDRELVEELIAALDEEWRINHKAFCQEEYPHSGNCLYEMNSVLKKWKDQNGPKCEYCGRVRDQRKPWQKFCSPKCTSAAWRQREKIKKLAEKSE